MIYFVTNDIQLFETSEYTIITSQESLDIISKWNRVQFDTETTGLDARIDSIKCIQFGNKAANIQVVVDVTTVDIQLYKTILETIPLIGQNIKFDLKMLYKHSIIPKVVYDTMIVEQFLHLGYPPVHKGGISYALDEIVYRYLGVWIDKSVRGDIMWRGFDTDVIKYAANDVVYLEDVMELQIEKCTKEGMLMGAKLECDFIPALAYVEWCGIRLSESKWKDKMNSDESKLEQKRLALNEYVQTHHSNTKFCSIDTQGDLFSGFNPDPVCNINWGSSTQVIKYFKLLGFDTVIIDKKTSEEKDSVMEKHLKGQKGINDEFLSLYFDFKEAEKVVSTYGQSYLNAINPITGRIHTEFKQLGAASGRMSCGSQEVNKSLAKLKGLPINKVKDTKLNCCYPQLQNLPSDNITRGAFIPEDANLMCSADYSALESRLGADIYKEQSMIEEFLYGSGDIHSLVAKACFPEELKDVSVKEVATLFPKLRSKAKPIGFSQQFGGSATAIKSALGCTLELAESIANNYNSGFPGIATFKLEGSKFVKKNGYILICELTGHRIYWHDHDDWLQRANTFTREYWDEYKRIKNSMPLSEFKQTKMAKEVSMHFKAASKWDRLALNSPTQGSGIIILKHAITEFFNYIVDNNFFNIILICDLIHDEAVIEYPKVIPGIDFVLKKYMEDAAAIYCKSLPIPASPAVGDHWIH